MSSAAADTTPARDRGILFSGPMVRALLAGKKTQTRRAVKFTPTKGRTWFPERAAVDAAGTVFGSGPYLKVPFTRHDDPGDECRDRVRCPYGYPGDRLWVRETWCGPWPSDVAAKKALPVWGYRATDAHDQGGDLDATQRWTPGIHMPRSVSRLTLEITEVRVQRLHELTEEDAIAEGIAALEPREGGGATHRDAFYVLWDKINGKKTPAAGNPWVWALTFRRIA